jgi:uncharacterized protein YcfJ
LLRLLPSCLTASTSCLRPPRDVCKDMAAVKRRLMCKHHDRVSGAALLCDWVRMRSPQQMQ